MTTPTRRRVTPAGLQILTADTDRATWLAARRKLLCSSDVAAILGVTQYSTPLHVWHEKLGNLPDDQDDAGEPAYWGTTFEDAVARRWCQLNRSVIRRIGLITNAQEPWMGATLDRLVAECPLDGNGHGRCFLEVKCRSAFKAGQWNRNIPDDVMAQVVWAMAVGGFDHCHIAVLIGGNEFRQFTIRPEPQLVQDIVAAGSRFWHTNVLGRIEPEVPDGYGTELAQLYDDLHPHREGNTHLDDLDSHAQIAELTAEYERARLDETDAKGRKEDARAALLRLLGGGENLILADDLVLTYTGHDKTTIDSRRLREHHPDAAADCEVTKTVRTMRLAKRYRHTR